MPQSKQEKKIAISYSHPSGHGHSSKASNDAFVAGVKYNQAKEKLMSNAKAGKPHAQLSHLAGKVQQLKEKADRLRKKAMEENA